MKVKCFEDLIAWKKAQELAINLYDVFKNNKDFSFKDQILRAVVSISNNIAEGFDRNSTTDFSRFLYIAKSSCSEVKSMLYLSKQLNYITEEKSNELIHKSVEISKIITGLINSLKKFNK